MVELIEPIYKRFLEVTGDPGAAATLVLAEVLSTKEPEWLDIKQAAARLQISRNKVYQLCAEGKVRHKKIGRQIRITPRDLDQVTEIREKKRSVEAALEELFKR